MAAETDPWNTSIDQLVQHGQAEPEHLQFERGRRLGKAAWDLIDHTIALHMPPYIGSDHGQYSTAELAPVPVSDRVTANVFFLMANAYRHLAGTPEWIRHSYAMELRLGVYDSAADMNDLSKEAVDTHIMIQPKNTVFIPVRPDENRHKPYTAYFEDGVHQQGLQLYPQHTETVIGILQRVRAGMGDGA